MVGSKEMLPSQVADSYDSERIKQNLFEKQIIDKQKKIRSSMNSDNNDTGA